MSPTPPPAPDAVASSSAPDRRLLRRSLEFVRPHTRTLAGVLSLALVLSCLSAIDPLILKFLFDLLGGGGDLRQFGFAMSALLVAELGRAGLTSWLGSSSWDLRLKVEYAVRERVTAKLNSLPVAYHQREGVGGLINRMNQAVMGYVTAASDLSFNVLPVVLYLGIKALRRPANRTTDYAPDGGTKMQVALTAPSGAALPDGVVTYTSKNGERCAVAGFIRGT